MTDPTRGTRTTPATGTTGATEVRGQTTDNMDRAWRRFRETKPSFQTTELWLMLAGVAALIITYNVADTGSLDLWRTCLLCVVLGAAYVVSRGIAKAGSHSDAWNDDRSRR